MGFNKKYRGRTKVHLMKVKFNNTKERLKFTSNRKSTFLVIPEGLKGNGWEKLKLEISSLLVALPKMIVYKGKQSRSFEIFFFNKVGPLN